MKTSEQSSAIRLFQITDTHCFADDGTRLTWTDLPVYPNRSLRAVLDHLQSQAKGHAAIVLTGDLAQEETAETYQRISELLSVFPLPCYALPGNHDAPQLMNGNLGGTIQTLKNVQLGVWHLFLLDSHKPGQPYGQLTGADIDFLKVRLSQVSKTEFVALFVHHHPIDIESKWMDEMGLRERDAFWKTLEPFPQVRAVFHGHAHQEFEGYHEYESGRKVMVYGTPATCIQVKPRTKALEFDHARPGWREIVLRPDGKVETQVNYLTSVTS